MFDEVLHTAFEKEIVNIDVKNIVYSKDINAHLLNSRKFKVIVSSIEEIGIIEPPVVTCKNGRYLLLDGHLRVSALKKLNIPQVKCLLSTDDEAFTYNKHVNRLTNIQEHRMIVKAIERGVSVDRLAKVLDMEVENIMRKKNLLDGIDPEVVELLKDKATTEGVFRYLRKMRPQRQVEAANLMNDMNNYGAKFARSIWLASSDKQLINPIKRANTLDVEKLGRLENEVSKVQGEYKLMEDKYGIDVLNLTLVKGYIRKILGNERVCSYLRGNEYDIFQQFERIVELDSINTTNERLF